MQRPLVSSGTPLWLLERGAFRVAAEIVPCPLGDWLRVWQGDAFVFGLIASAREADRLDAEADEQRRGHERRGFVAVQAQ